MIPVRALCRHARQQAAAASPRNSSIGPKTRGCRVRRGSIASLWKRADHFRSNPNFGHAAAPHELTLSANKRLMHRSISRDAASGTHSGKPRRAKAFSNIARRFGVLMEAKVNICLKVELRRCGYRARK
jgi:hypothetical protein